MGVLERQLKAAREMRRALERGEDVVLDGETFADSEREILEEILARARRAARRAEPDEGRDTTEAPSEPPTGSG